MTILRGTIVQQFLSTEGYGAISGMLSFPSNIAKGIAPICAASIWRLTPGYVAVEWTVLLVSMLRSLLFRGRKVVAGAAASWGSRSRSTKGRNLQRSDLIVA